MASNSGRGTRFCDAHWASEADAWRPPSSAVATARPRFTGYPFTLGVASGAPTPESVVLWTRLAPEPLAGGGVREESVVVRWEVASDDAFRRVVRQGTVDTLAGQGHSVHVPVNGLPANRWHWYRFAAGDDVSPVGRTRTLPGTGANPTRLKLAYGSCQQFEQGYYAAHRHILDEDVDFMVFLGDYMYESSWGVNLVRRHAGGEPRTLAEYRNRHAQYKTDPDLQALHAQVPWLVIWDDHEVDNDYADWRSEDLDPQFIARRAAGYQAYFEHMPLPESARPRGPDAWLYARYDFGRLARIHVLDGRQYRTPQACPRAGRGGANVVGEDCRELFDPERTMLSAQQERWLHDGVRGAAERWNVLAQATLMGRADPRLGGEEQFWTDAWDGYPAARTRLLTGLRDRDARSCVVISGDAHATFACDLRQDAGNEDSPIVATEVSGTSITSQGRPASQIETLLRENPDIHYADASRRGYTVLDITPGEARVVARVIDDAAVRTTGVSTARTFTIERDRPGIQL